MPENRVLEFQEAVPIMFASEIPALHRAHQGGWLVDSLVQKGTGLVGSERGREGALPLGSGWKETSPFPALAKARPPRCVPFPTVLLALRPALGPGGVRSCVRAVLFLSVRPALPQRSLLNAGRCWSLWKQRECRRNWSDLGFPGDDREGEPCSRRPGRGAWAWAAFLRERNLTSGLFVGWKEGHKKYLFFFPSFYFFLIFYQSRKHALSNLTGKFYQIREPSR